MESLLVSAGEREDLPLKVPISPIILPQPSTLTPPYIISAEEVIADQDQPSSVNRRTGSVLKGFWNNSLVGIKVLSNDTPVDVSKRYFNNQFRNLTLSTRIIDIAKAYQILACLEASSCAAGLRCIFD
jgi:hypothetical protein